MLKMKKFIGTIIAIAVIVVPSTQSFAYENKKVIDLEVMNKAPIVFSKDEERASISGDFGTAYIGYMSSAKMLNWRLTPKELIGSFSGTILVTNMSGLPVKTYYVSGSGMSPTGQISVSALKKGTYKATFAGNGVTVSGKKFNILPGLSETFTKY